MKDAVASPVGNPSVVYMTQSGYRQILSVGRQASSFVVVTTQHDGDFQATVSREIEERFKRVNLPVAATTTTTDRVSENRFTFNLLTTFLLMMAGILAIVGALGLTGTMSINVLERTREIGVMRAIGASNASVRGVIIVEGVVIGVISWAVGAVLAYPIMRLLNEQVGRVIIKQVPPHTYSWQGLWLWFFVVMLVALFASLMPAWRASRLTVREVLAYE
jgi:putative ABC transport system permease protein